MTIHIWAAGDDFSFPVEGKIKLVTYQAAGAVATKSTAAFWAGGNHGVYFDGADFVEVVSDLGDASQDERIGMPPVPPESPHMDGPAGMHAILTNDGRIIYLSSAPPTPREPSEAPTELPTDAPTAALPPSPPKDQPSSPAPQHR